MVCIIDDRDDVWNFAPNLVQVRPYRYFEGTGDINSPPGLPPNNPSASKTDIGSRDGKSSAEGKNDDKTKEKTEDDSDGEGGDESATDLSKSDTSKVTDSDSKVVGDSNVTDDDSKAKDESNVKEAESEVKEDSSVQEDVAKLKEEDSRKDAGESKQTPKVEDELEEGELEKEPSDEKAKSPESEKDQDKKTEVEKTPEELEEDCNDDYFLHLEEILIKIHAAFFKIHDKAQDKSSASEADLKTIIPQIRKNVLSGTYIVFSGVFPTNMPPEQSRAWKAAVTLGAHVSVKIVPRDKSGGGPANATTHLIAAKVGTNKVSGFTKQITECLWFLIRWAER